MEFTWQATPGHSKSFPLSELNPKNYPIDQESYSLRIPAKNLPHGITDEEVLARFSKGVFGGGYSLLRGGWHLTSSSDPALPGHSIWKLESLSRNTLPPLGSTLFGLLTLFDTSACTEAHRISVFPESQDIPRPNFAFAEYAGRTKSLSLAASHRFEVNRELKGSEDVIQLTFSHVRSNPANGGKPLPGWFIWFHVLYSKLLFADGIRELLRN
ncbi:uncharacterized protein N7500_001260 [Penicillium coprophilum]|uniref:uncharacterized protein n=1 Tax=Penicillium coprophilum TaxID=36646 RepID=UPI002388ADDD|nr:uncharacterized protein N7500_001260 [Penicillium coprophilum]KAJ5178561.1 hypothetical protein N7500_001260 [Penicillium coprophilum]